MTQQTNDWTHGQGERQRAASAAARHQPWRTSWNIK